jgi:hypothetical protein
MKTTIESFTDYKKNEYGPSAKVRLGTGEVCFINEEPDPLVGKTVEIEVTDKPNRAGTRTYKIGKIGKIYEATATTANGNSNGSFRQITWDDYRSLAEAAHALAKQLEPDEGIVVDGAGRVIDRSPARVGFVNNVMRAYADGRFIVPKDDEDDTPPF